MVNAMLEGTGKTILESNFLPMARRGPRETMEVGELSSLKKIIFSSLVIKRSKSKVIYGIIFTLLDFCQEK